jgi:hypothetical protein
MTVEQRVQSAVNRAVWFRNYQRARARAMTKLTQLYPETYKQLFEIERSIDEQEGKSWIDITGATRMAISASAPSRDTTGTQEARASASASNDGGEA